MMLIVMTIVIALCICNVAYATTGTTSGGSTGTTDDDYSSDFGDEIIDLSGGETTQTTTTTTTTTTTKPKTTTTTTRPKTTTTTTRPKTPGRPTATPSAVISTCPSPTAAFRPSPSWSTRTPSPRPSARNWDSDSRHRRHKQTELCLNAVIGYFDIAPSAFSPIPYPFPSVCPPTHFPPISYLHGHHLLFSSCSPLVHFLSHKKRTGSPDNIHILSHGRTGEKGRPHGGENRETR